MQRLSAVTAHFTVLHWAPILSRWQHQTIHQYVTLADVSTQLLPEGIPGRLLWIRYVKRSSSPERKEVARSIGTNCWLGSRRKYIGDARIYFVATTAAGNGSRMGHSTRTLTHDRIPVVLERYTTNSFDEHKLDWYSIANDTVYWTANVLYWHLRQGVCIVG